MSIDFRILANTRTREYTLVFFPEYNIDWEELMDQKVDMGGNADLKPDEAELCTYVSAAESNRASAKWNEIAA